MTRKTFKKTKQSWLARVWNSQKFWGLLRFTVTLIAVFWTGLVQLSPEHLGILLIGSILFQIGMGAFEKPNKEPRYRW